MLFKTKKKKKNTDPANTSDAHVSGANVARGTVESSLSPRYDYAFLRVGAVKLARLR